MTISARRNIRTIRTTSATNRFKRNTTLTTTRLTNATRTFLFAASHRTAICRIPTTIITARSFTYTTHASYTILSRRAHIPTSSAVLSIPLQVRAYSAAKGVSNDWTLASTGNA